MWQSAPHRFPLTPELFRLSLTIVLFNSGYSIYLFLFNFYLSAQGGDEHWMGLLHGIMVFGGVCGALPVGHCAKRYGLRPTLGFGLVAGGLLFALRTLSTLPALQLLLALASGFFVTAWTVLIFPAIAATVDEKDRAMAFPLLYGLGVASGCLGALAGGWLPTLLPLAPLAARQVGLLLGATLIALSAFALPSDRPTETISAPAPLRKNLLPMLLASALFAFLLACFNPFAGVFFAAQFHLSLASIGNYFFFVQILVALSLFFFAATVARRFAPAHLLVALQVGAGLMLAILALPSLPLAAVAYLLFMLVQQLAQPTLQALCMSHPSPQVRASIASWNALGITLAQAAATPIAGVLFHNRGYAHTLPYLGLFTFSSAVTWLFLRNPKKQCCGEQSTQQEQEPGLAPEVRFY